jgi:hypothetical protein
LPEMIGISQGFKTFWVYSKALLKTILNPLFIFLKNFFEKEQISKYYFFPVLYSNLCKLACKGVNHKCVLFSKIGILKN